MNQKDCINGNLIYKPQVDQLIVYNTRHFTYATGPLGCGVWKMIN